MDTTELLAQWAESKRKEIEKPREEQYQRFSEQVSILQQLRQAGVTEVPGEFLPVSELLEERQDVIQRMRDICR